MRTRLVTTCDFPLFSLYFRGNTFHAFEAAGIEFIDDGAGVRLKNLLHGTAPFHVVVATTTLWHIDAAIVGPFRISKSRQVKGKWPDQPLDHHSGCPS
jgi:hypothetical protein